MLTLNFNFFLEKYQETRLLYYTLGVCSTLKEMANWSSEVAILFYLGIVVPAAWHPSFGVVSVLGSGHSLMLHNAE